jgi:hypothetical protein
MTSQYEKRRLKNLEENSDPETKTENVTPIYDKTGYDIFRDDSTGKFFKVIIEYDLTTMAARVKEVKSIADSLPRAIQESQKVFVNKLMGIKGE